ncbi:MAG: cation transporter [Parvibaculaceae bacterium]|nr:cation transporter [Parvibaculaceae bacterium]
MDTHQEQSVLRLSIWATLGVGLIGVGVGLWSSSQSITFDGFYSIVDSALTVVALLVSRLVAREGSRRFQFGYWHFEPLFTTFNGTILTLACLYAFLGAVTSLATGGHRIDFGPAAAYALVIAISSYVMLFYVGRKARALDSELLRIDARGWLMGGSMSTSLLASFGLGSLLVGTDYAYLVPYVDPAVLMVLALVLLPLPVSTVTRSLREVFQLAPSGLDTQVREVMDATCRKYGFVRYRSYVMKIGRAQFIEIQILTTPHFKVGEITDLDRIRAEIGAQLGESSPQRWLTIAFTSNPAWI